jgi:hypothetical protein
MKIIKEIPIKRSDLQFDQKHFQENYELLLNYQGINFYDTGHTIIRFKERFPSLSIDRFYDTLKKGIKKIYEKWDYQQNFYIIFSYKYKIKIPIQIREDRYNPNVLVGAIATVLHADNNPYDTVEGIKILVEKYKKYDFVRIEESEELEGWFKHYVELGEYWKEFEYIKIED